MPRGLRGKILLFTVTPLVTVVVATLWLVNHQLSSQINESLRDDLKRAAAVLENVWTARGRGLLVAGQVIVQDPRFFSVLTLPGVGVDPEASATVTGVARDFNSLVEADLFDVIDNHGRLLASVGRDRHVLKEHGALVAEALAGRPVTGEIAQGPLHYQAAAAPVVVGGRVVGALLLGSVIDRELAEQLKKLTRSDVTFASQSVITATTLESTHDRDDVIASLGVNGARSSVVLDGTIFELGDETGRRLTVIKPLPASDVGTRQFYVLQRSVSAETAPLRSIQSKLVQLGIIAMLVTLIACFWIAERITRPVQKLVRGAEEMERGNYDYPLDVASRDEIGMLARRFGEMRQRLRDLIRSLREAGRMRTEFINVTSHELRTPLSAIRGWQEILASGAAGPVTEQQRHALEVVGQATARLEFIAERTTRMSQIDQPLERSAHDCAHLVEEALARVRSMSQQRQVAMEADVDGVGRLFVDGPALAEAIFNLVSNGVRFTPDGGRVTVRGRRDGGDVVLEVIDTGVGIPKDRQSDVFERPFMVRSSLHHHSSSALDFNSAGLGMGLAHAQGIVQSHGGNLTLRSDAGRGTTMTMRFPYVPPDAEVRAA